MHPLFIAKAYIRAIITGRKHRQCKHNSCIKCRKMHGTTYVCVTRDVPAGNYMRGAATWFIPVKELLP
jgi:hypothetical protein